MKTALAFLTSAALLSADPKLPPFQKEVNSSGAIFIAMPRQDVPLFALRVVIRGGAESDPPGLAGLSAITAEMLRRGTKTRSAAAFAAELDEIGATLRTRSDAQSTQISLQCLSRHALKAIELVADAVLSPAFAEAEVRKTLSEALDQARSIKDEPEVAIAFYFRSLLFGAGHPYSRPPSGDEVSLAKMDRASLLKHHAATYTGPKLIVVAAGEIDAKNALDALKNAFRAPKNTLASPISDKAVKPLKTRLLLVDKPDATQTYFRIGTVGIHRTHPDRTALDLVNTLFGGRFTSLLNEELRVNTGLTYGASSHFDLDRLPGQMYISTFTRTETTKRAIDLALDVLKRLLEKGIQADQLASAKAYVKGTYPPENLETATQLAAKVAELELYGLNRGEVDDYFSRVDAVTLEQANSVARKYWGGGGLQFVVLGNAAKIRNDVRGYATAIQEVPIQRPGYPAFE
jgi:predicted Zn-dependent peptidase